VQHIHVIELWSKYWTPAQLYWVLRYCSLAVVVRTRTLMSWMMMERSCSTLGLRESCSTQGLRKNYSTQGLRKNYSTQGLRKSYSKAVVLSSMME